MDIEKLRTLVSAAQCGNFSEAAEELFLTTSTVSKHISSLEAELGVSIFQRLPKGVALTDKGRICLAYAEKTVDEYDKLLSRLKKEKLVRIGTFPVHSGLMNQVRHFKEQHGDIEFRLTTEHGLAVVRSVLEGSYKLGVVGTDYSGDAALERCIFSQNTRGVVVPESHPLASRGSISIKELARFDICLLSPETGMYDSYVRLCREHGFEPRIVATSEREDNLLDYVRDGKMFSIFPENMFLRFNHSGLKFLPFEERIMGGVALIRRKDHPLSTEAQLFWDYVANNTNKTD